MDDLQPSADSAARRGRPPGTSRRALELIALRLFTEQGFDETPIEQIAAEAGVSRRTFFRYFDSKASVLWGEFDSEVTVIRDALARVPDSVPMMDAIRQAVVAANHYRVEDVTELRAIVLCERGVRDGVQAIASSCRTDAASPRLKAALKTFQG